MPEAEIDKRELNNKEIYGNEESNVSVWNATGGHQDVPPGEGVPEVSCGV